MSTATVPAPYTTLTNFSNIPPLMKDESFVNGVWGNILAMYFPFPAHVIEPEKYTAKDNKADLFVHRIQDGRPMLCYEGKIKGGKDATFDKAIAQAGKYMSETGARFGMAGIGSKVVFVVFKGSDLWELKFQSRGGGPVAMREHNPLDILTDSGAIHNILTYIQQQVSSL
ncbi:hypothetical protein FRB93_011202 [Tulasnella sp. JGI-2019a]|nr:hypothetical protein FRB93_011202 [Tulasnella sp. JGI-2019a]